MDINELIIIGFIIVALTILVSKLSGSNNNTPAESVGELSDEKIKDIATGGQKVTAIKLYRQLHNVGLKDAKEAVEKML